MKAFPPFLTEKTEFPTERGSLNTQGGWGILYQEALGVTYQGWRPFPVHGTFSQFGKVPPLGFPPKRFKRPFGIF